VSPDGRISQRDVASKLVIVMVGLPVRGKSYIAQKLARYLNWLQHNIKIFDVGEKRRVVAHHGPHAIRHNSPEHTRTKSAQKAEDALTAARILINGNAPGVNISTLNLPEASMLTNDREEHHADPTSPQAANTVRSRNDGMDGSASFFDPNNASAAAIREQCAVETLDELLDYVLNEGGSVGILDDANVTLPRRKMVMRHIRERDRYLNVLFIESIYEDEALAEANIRLKLSGPDYKDKGPVASLEDFKKPADLYKEYVPVGEYEEKHNMSYVKVIDVGRKVISHQIEGFLSAQVVYYLLNFNLAPRQIWITRHGESLDNVAGKIGGDSDLSTNGHKYGQALMIFVREQRTAWEQKQAEKQLNTHFPPHSGGHTPPNPHFSPEGVDMNSERSFCVWTSMLKRSVKTGDYFDEEEFDVKQMRMLDEMNTGIMEGMTYPEIRIKFPEEYLLRQRDKLSYRYPRPGGEGYLTVTNRLRPVIMELERMTDHCLIITHRSVARVLLAYFTGLQRDDVPNLDCPLGMLYALEPKPYGVEFKAYRYNPQIDSFDYLPEFQLKMAAHPH
jgi:6-phosphofructo-2-kinase